ncbi:hypothetical protein EV191_110141 [Tamaricihabitans halophyticus]|uniref:Uncharacterized protein n=1 Tax=Tamaricihabitans halophyticus TaxID=1262583 RepID=A0A4R2QNE3_9PSEU|nr:hypothetical protein [Tamaricihabitans halophyticus]TCP48581.1 hypothetical protein EV191_110141 [Tamaricihabitans halophyticus]
MAREPQPSDSKSRKTAKVTLLVLEVLLRAYLIAAAVFSSLGCFWIGIFHVVWLPAKIAMIAAGIVGFVLSIYLFRRQKPLRIQVPACLGIAAFNVTLFLVAMRTDFGS